MHSRIKGAHTQICKYTHATLTRMDREAPVPGDHVAHVLSHSRDGSQQQIHVPAQPAGDHGRIRYLRSQKFAQQKINTAIMRITTLLTALWILACGTSAQAGHGTGNGTCTDDIKHWSNMIEKRSDAPLYHESKEMQSRAIGERVTGDYLKCEEYMEEALRMIRKTGGEYPTE